MVEKQTRSINRSVPVPGLSHKPHVCPAPHSSSPLKPKLGPPPSYTGGKSGGPCQATLVDCPSVRVYGCPQELRMCFPATAVPLSSALQGNSRISKQHRQALWQTQPWASRPLLPAEERSLVVTGILTKDWDSSQGPALSPRRGCPSISPCKVGGPRCVQLHLRPPAHGCFPRCRWSFGRLFLGNWRLLDHRDSALSLNSLLLPS